MNRVLNWRIARNNFLVFLTISISIGFFNSKTAYSQCTNLWSFGTAAAPTTSATTTISTCTYQEEYNTITSVVAGQTYLSTNSAGGCITVHSGTPGGPVVGFGSSPLSWTATVSGTYYIHYTVNCACATTFGCTTTTISCTSCGAVYNPCSSVTNIAGCGASVTANMNGSGAGWSAGTCLFSTPGQEMIYSFTAPTTGNYTIDVTSFSGPDYVNFSYVNSTAGCSSTAGWTCIDEMFFTGSTFAFPMTAGQTYYILLDPEWVGSYSVTFNIGCPGTAVTAGDCSNAVNVCTNLTFAVDPNGFGATDEICPAGTCVSNPDINPASANQGCLLSGELNSTWMVVNIATGGTLEFSFGTPGGFVCYDWIMWPYSPTACANIFAGTHAPVRCNWNNTCTGFTGIAGTVPPGGFAGDFEPVLTVTAGQQFVICFSNYSSATTSVPLSFFGSASVSCVPLAVEFSSFSGYKTNDDVMLNWKGESMVTAMHYDVLHSINAVDFTNIGRISAKELSAAAEIYEYKHLEPLKGINYYKLLKTNLDSKTEESSVVAINFDFNGIKIDEIYPNPTSDFSFVKIESAIETDLDLFLFDLTGKILEHNPVHVTKGKNQIKINTRPLAKGIYQVTIRTVDGITNQSSKIVVN